jgi:hypothetical protein
MSKKKKKKGGKTSLSIFSSNRIAWDSKKIFGEIPNKIDSFFSSSIEHLTFYEGDVW